MIDKSDLLSDLLNELRMFHHNRAVSVIESLHAENRKLQMILVSREDEIIDLHEKLHEARRA